MADGKSGFGNAVDRKSGPVNVVGDCSCEGFREIVCDKRVSVMIASAGSVSTEL